MHELPIVSKKYFPGGVSGANVTCAYWYEPQEDEELGKKGGIGLLISLMGPDDFSGERTTKFMWDSFQEEYYYSKEADPKKSLRSAVKTAQQRLVELIQHEDGVSEQGVDLHMCAFVICGLEMFMTQIGEPGVILVRDGEVVALSDMIPSFSGVGYTDDISIGSFKLLVRDMLLLSTPKLMQSFLDALGSEGEESLATWLSIVTELELFAENMAGNQYIWLLGYGIPQKDRISSEADDKTEESDQEGDKAGDVVGEEKDVIVGDLDYKDADSDEKQGRPAISSIGLPDQTSGKPEKSEGEHQPLYTPGGIWGRAQNAWNTKIHSKIKQMQVFDRVKSKLPAISALKDPQTMSGVRRSLGASFSRLKLRGGVRRPMVIGRALGLSSVLSARNIAIVAVLSVLAVFILVSWRNTQHQQRIAANGEVLEEVSALTESARDTWEVQKNRTDTTALLEEATGKLDDLEDSELEEDQRGRSAELRSGIQGVYDVMNKVSPLSEDMGTIEILTDLYLKIGENADITDFEKYGGSLYIVDNASHAIYRYMPSDDVIEKVANSGEILKFPQKIAIGEGYMFVYDDEVGVATLDMNEDEPDWTMRVRPELSARTVGDVTDIGAFADNVYILKRDEARVLKSYPAGAGYSYPEEYFRHGAFDKGVDLLIDGNIYVLSDGSDKLYKYFGGQQDPFSLSGFDTPLGDVCCGSTNLNDTGKLYVFDSTNKRLVSIEKAAPDRHPGVGVLVRQYVYRGQRDEIFDDVKEIVVDVDERVVYVLDGTRILRVLLEND